MTQITQSGSIDRPCIVNVILGRFALLLILRPLAGCAGGLGQTFMVQFMPFSATPMRRDWPLFRRRSPFPRPMRWTQ